jgi:hypothetical protein
MGHFQEDFLQSARPVTIIFERLGERLAENDPGTIRTITKEAASPDKELHRPTTPGQVPGLAEIMAVNTPGEGAANRAAGFSF